MIQYTQVTRYDFIFQDGSGGEVYAFSMIGDYNNRALQRHPLSESNVARHCQVIQLEKVGYRRKSSEEFLHLWERDKNITLYNKISIYVYIYILYKKVYIN